MTYIRRDFKRSSYLLVLMLFAAWALVGSHAFAANCEFVDPVEILGKRLNGTAPFHFVDIRSEQLFADAHIPDSMPIPLYFLKTKTYLKAKSLVIVGSGAEAPMLETACRELSGLGFDRVSLLEGGMNSWRRAGGNVAGALIGSDEWSKITPFEFERDKRKSLWTAFLFTPVEKAAEETTSRFEIVSPDLDKSARQISDLIKARAVKGYAAIVVANEDGIYRNEFRNRSEQIVKESASRFSLFYLEGGVRALKEFRDLNKAKQRRSTATFTLRSQDQNQQLLPEKVCGSCPR